jgi:acyl-CoA synthetase (AMP-forming)/AMP-acid ligase II
MNIVEILSDHARNRPDHPAIEDGARIVTYGELDGLVDAAAANLDAAGVRQGHVVAVLLNESADHLVILCALARIGAVIFSLNAALSKNETQKSLASVAVDAVIAHDHTAPGDGLNVLMAENICRPTTATFDRPDVGDKDPVMLIQSSGTTGEPKSFLRHHTGVAEGIGRYVRSQGWTEDERCFSLTRMSFNVGRDMALGMLRIGATYVVNDSRGPLSHGELTALVRDRRISYMFMTPSHMIPLLDYAADKAPLFPGLRGMMTGSAPITHAQRLLARERLTPNFMEAIGANEVGLLASASPADQDAHPDSLGRMIEGVEAEIVDDEDRLLPAGQVGLVRFRGAGNPPGYLDNPEATAVSFRDGWFYPGDLAALNEEGFFFFKGMADDVINNAGAKFYPIEVEAVLMAHPQISAAAAFAWPHTKLGQVAVACVAVNSEISAAELQAFCKQQMAGYKVPAIIEIMAELPRNAMGKILKSELKDVIERSVTESKAKR